MLNNWYKKFERLSALAMASALVITISACSDSDNDRLSFPVGGGDPDPDPVVTVSGDVAKGIVVNGVVSIYPITSSSIDTTSLLGTGTTDSTGHYDSVELTGYDGGPIAVRVTAASDDTTSMVCDLSNGCGDGVAFGEMLTLSDTDFSLDAIVPSVDDMSPSVNVSVLTNVASGVALQTLMMDNTADVTTAINNANTSVANRFGLTGNVTQLPIIDVTNPNTVATTDSATLQYNLFNAAIVQSVLTDNNMLSLQQSVSSFANQWLTNGGLADTESEGSAGVTLSNILRDASQVINSIETTAQANMVMINLGGLQSQIDASAAVAENGSTTPSGGTPAVDNDDDALQLVKDEVAELRTLLTALGVTGTNGMDPTDPELFADQVELAANTIGGDTEYALEALAYAAAAISRAFEAHFESETPPAEFFDEVTDINVVITETDGVRTYAVDDTVAVTRANGMPLDVDVVLSADDSDSTFEENPEVMDNTDGSTTETNVFTASVNMVIEGSATVAESVTITIEDGTVAVSLSGEEELTDGALVEDMTTGESSQTFTREFAAEITDLAFNVDVTIEQLAVTDPVTFEGDLELTVSSATLDESETETDQLNASQEFIGFSGMFVEEETVALVNLTIAGGFNSDSGQSLMASLNIAADGDGVVFTCEESFSEDFVMGTFIDDIDCTGETEESFVAVDATLILMLDIAGVDDDASVVLAGNRSGLDGFTLSVRISYGTSVFDIDYITPESDTDLQSITITSEAGVVVFITETADDTIAAGNVTLNEVEYGVIEESAGAVVVTYTDGEFETLF